MTNSPDPDNSLLEHLRRFADRERGDVDRLAAVFDALRSAERQVENELDSEELWVRVEARIGGDAATDEL